MVRIGAVLCAAASVAGCYSPAYEDCKITCTSTCPSGLSCISGFCRVSASATDVCGQGTGDSGVDVAVIDGLPQDGPPSDLDADGILNANDNCPTKANPDQANEDGDSFGDVCDPCPWLGTVADNNDGDNDGVGDGCDPRPTTPGDRIVLFEGFAANAMPPLATVVGPGPWIFGGGTASISASGGMPAQLVWPLATYPLGETVYTHVTIDQLISFPAVIGITDQNNIAVNQGTACEVEAPNPTQNSVTLANVSGAIFMQNFFSQNVIGTPTIIRSTRQGAQQYTCTVTLTGLPSNASGAMGPTPIKAGFRVRNAAAHFDWIAVVSAQ